LYGGLIYPMIRDFVVRNLDPWNGKKLPCRRPDTGRRIAFPGSCDLPPK
jgi:hypothetical protein